MKSTLPRVSGKATSVWRAELNRLKRDGILRSLREIESAQGPEAKLDGRRVVMLCSNNYLGLADHPRLREAAVRAIERYGFGTGGARLISGAMTSHRELEEKIARFKRTEAALVFNSGYHANLGIISALAGRDAIIYSDALNHASIIDGCRLSGASVRVYRHADANHLETLLKKDARGQRKPARLVVSDTVFSMDGDTAPLPDLVSVASRFGAWLMVDEAHATGVFGATGGGLVEEFGLQDGVPIQMGTLGKALGCFGAYVAGSRDLIDLLINKARSFIFTTSLPPAVCAAAAEAVDLVKKGTGLRKNLWKRTHEYVEGLNRLGIESAKPRSPIIPIVIGENRETMTTCAKLLKRGVFAQGIRFPSVPKGTARLRTSIMATHTPEHVKRALTALAQCLPSTQHPELGI